MKVVIAGAGRSGRSVAMHLSSTGHKVTLIDRDPVSVKEAFELHGLVSLNGDATNAHTLREAEADKADVLVAMLPRDADNLATAALARAAGAKRIMVRVKDDEYRGIYVAAGVTRILSESDVYIGALATAIEHDRVKSALLVGNGTAVAFELELPSGEDKESKTVSEIATMSDFPSSCIVAGIFDTDGKMESPRGASKIHAGMTLLLVSRREHLGLVVEFFTRHFG
jgi:trk system potassium uptake protein TrkA